MQIIMWNKQHVVEMEREQERPSVIPIVWLRYFSRISCNTHLRQSIESTSDSEEPITTTRLFSSTIMHRRWHRLATDLLVLLVLVLMCVCVLQTSKSFSSCIRCSVGWFNLADKWYSALLAVCVRAGKQTVYILYFIGKMINLMMSVRETEWECIRVRVCVIFFYSI